MAPICVTGASGYIGGFVVEELLKLGCTVHATVRDPADKKNDFLRDMAKRVGTGTLVFFAADLQKAGAFDDAVKGCDVVVHVAAVVQTNYKKDPFAEVITPTVEGVVNIVGSCKKHRVRRIVYTSSVSTILCAEKYRNAEVRGKPFTEDEWLTHVTPTYGTYNYAKIAAEKKLNELWDGECVSLLPSWCIGRQQNDRVTSSQQVPRAILRREYKLACPPIYLMWVDVRDVARAHAYAATTPKMPSGRYTVAGPGMATTGEMAATFNKIDPSLALATRLLPWTVMWAASWFDQRISTQFLYESCVARSRLSTERIESVGFEFKHRDLEATLRDCLESFREHSIIPPAAAAS